jgi:hypothetical protein
VAAVLLVTRTADREIDLVGRRLTAAGIPVERLDAEYAGQTDLVIDADLAMVRLRGQWITPTVTWVRHCSARAMPERRGAARRIFTGQSWQALADQLGTVSVRPVTSRAPGTLEQLALARRQGIAVPRTIVTTDPASARHLLGGDRVVIKAVHQHFVEASPGLLTGVFPEITDLGELAGRSGGTGPPVLVQDYVDHDLEIRAYYIGGQITTFSIGKEYPAQLWLQPEQVTAEQIDPPAAVADAVRALAEAMSLEYGAFDFLSAGRIPVFLEMNVSGDWCWLEKKAGGALVTEAVTSMLAEFHREALGNARSAGKNQLDPVRFLTGGLPAGAG